MEIILHVYVVLPGILYEPNGSLSVDRIEVRAKVNNNYTLLYSCYEEAGQEVIYPEASPSTSDEIPYLEFIKIDDEENQSITGYTSTKFVYTSPHADIKRAKDNYFFLFDLKEGDTNYKCLSVYDKAVEYLNNVTNTDGICFVPVAYSSDIVTFEIKLFSLVRYKSDTDEYSDKNYVYLDTVVFKYSPLIDIPVSYLTFNDDYVDMYYNLISSRETYDLKLNENVIVYKDQGNKKIIMTYDRNGFYKDTETELDIEKTLLWVHPLFGINGDCSTDIEEKSTTYDRGSRSLIFMPWMPTIKCSTLPVRYPPFYFGDDSNIIYMLSESSIMRELENGESYDVTDPSEMTEQEYFTWQSSKYYAWDGGLRLRLAINMACASPILNTLYPEKYSLPYGLIGDKSHYLDIRPDTGGFVGDYNKQDIDNRVKTLDYWLEGAFKQLKTMGIYYTNLLRPSYINNSNTTISFCYALNDNSNQFSFNHNSNFINVFNNNYRFQGDKGEDQIYDSTWPTGNTSEYNGWYVETINSRGYWPLGRNNWTVYSYKNTKVPNEYRNGIFKPITTKLLNGVTASTIMYKYADKNTITPKYLALYDNKNPLIDIINNSNIEPILVDYNSINDGTFNTTTSFKHNFIGAGQRKTVPIKDLLYEMKADSMNVLPECWLAVNYNTSNLQFSNKSDYQIRPKLTLLLGDTRYGVYEGSMVIANVSQENLITAQPWDKGLRLHVPNIYFNTQDRYYSIYSKDLNPINTKKTYSMSLAPGLYVLSINVERYTLYLDYDYSYHESLCTLTIGDETYTSEKRAGEVLVAFYIKDIGTTVHLCLSSYAFSHGVYGDAFTTGVGIHQVDYTADITEAIYNTNIKNIIADCDNTVIFDLGHDIYDNIVFLGVLSYTLLISRGSHGTYYYIELPESYQKVVACYSFDDNGNLVYTDKTYYKSSTNSFSKHQLPDTTVEEILNVAEPKILA